MGGPRSGGGCRNEDWQYACQGRIAKLKYCHYIYQTSPFVTFIPMEMSHVLPWHVFRGSQFAYTAAFAGSSILGPLGTG